MPITADDITFRVPPFKTATDDPRRTRTRAQLGLSTDRPIILAGHQAQLWHPGILAKWFAASSIAERHNAQPAWVTVDQDANKPADLSIPLNTENRWQRVQSSLAPSNAPPGTPTAGRPPIHPKLPSQALDPRIASRLQEAIAALDNTSDAPSSAAQFAAALDTLTQQPLTHLFATDLAKTTLYNELLDDIRADPAACRASWNTTVNAHPSAGIRPLRNDELPLWTLTQAGPRATATDADLDQTPLLPRGLLMTLLLRLAACDFFLHGLGGADYEPAADRWLSEWNPPALQGLAPAPFGVVSADLRLDLTGHDVPTKSDVAQAHWQAQHLNHHPDSSDEAVKLRKNLIERIESLPRKSPERLSLYRELHQNIAKQRETHANRIQHARDETKRATAAFRDRDVLNARDWPFPLYDNAQLDELRVRIEELAR